MTRHAIDPMMYDDLILDQIAGRRYAGADPVAMMLNDLALACDQPLGSATRRRRSGPWRFAGGALATVAFVGASATLAAALNGAASASGQFERTTPFAVHASAPGQVTAPEGSSPALRFPAVWSGGDQQALAVTLPALMASAAHLPSELPALDPTAALVVASAASGTLGPGALPGATSPATDTGASWPSADTAGPAGLTPVSGTDQATAAASGNGNGNGNAVGANNGTGAGAGGQATSAGRSAEHSGTGNVGVGGGTGSTGASNAAAGTGTGAGSTQGATNGQAGTGGTTAGGTGSAAASGAGAGAGNVSPAVGQAGSSAPAPGSPSTASVPVPRR